MNDKRIQDLREKQNRVKNDLSGIAERIQDLREKLNRVKNDGVKYEPIKFSAEGTMLEILQDGRIKLQASIEADSASTKQLFKDAAERLKTRRFLEGEEAGLQEFISIKADTENRKLWAYDTFNRIAADGVADEVGEVICSIITKNNWFQARLFETEDRLCISKQDDTTQLYFYPFKDGEAYFGWVSTLPNGHLYFQGVVIQHEYYYQTIDAVRTEFYKTNGKY